MKNAFLAIALLVASTSAFATDTNISPTVVEPGELEKTHGIFGL
jgi:hypothetical protein